MTRNLQSPTLVRATLLAVASSMLVACEVPLKKVSESYERVLSKQEQAQEKFNKLQRLIATLRTSEGVLPTIVEPSDDGEFSSRTNVDALLQKKLQEFSSNAELQRQAATLIDSEIERRNEQLLSKTRQLRDTPAEDIDARLALIHEIYILDGKQEQQQGNQEAAMQEASIQAFGWLQEARYEQAHSLFKVLVDHGFDSPDIQAAMSEADFHMQLVHLERQREQGDVDALYQGFLRMIGDPDHANFIDRLKPIALDLAGYYTLSANNEMLAGDLLETYLNLQKLISISDHADLSELDRTVEQDFISQMFVLADGARSAGHLGLAMAYLEIISEFEAEYIDVKRALNEIRRELYDAAIVKLAAFPFDSPANAPGLGALISATLIQHFIDTKYKDIKILERQNLDDVVKEQEIQSIASGHDVDFRLSASDYMIQGNVVEASVDTTIQDSRITKRVLVDVKRVPNPAYQEWLKLTPQQRKQLKISTPPVFLSEEVQEDISSTQTRYSKLGSVISNYRIIDSTNGELLHAGTLNLERTFEDDSLEGFEIGRFVQKAKIANLPADSKILRVLAESLAKDVALDLVAKLQEPEHRYLHAASEFQAIGRLRAAVQEIGKAIVILEAKETPVDAKLNELKLLALNIR